MQNEQVQNEQVQHELEQHELVQHELVQYEPVQHSTVCNSQNSPHSSHQPLLELEVPQQEVLQCEPSLPNPQTQNPLFKIRTSPLRFLEELLKPCSVPKTTVQSDTANKSTSEPSVTGESSSTSTPTASSSLSYSKPSVKCKGSLFQGHNDNTNTPEDGTDRSVPTYKRVESLTPSQQENSIPCYSTAASRNSILKKSNVPPIHDIVPIQEKLGSEIQPADQQDKAIGTATSKRKRKLEKEERQKKKKEEAMNAKQRRIEARKKKLEEQAKEKQRKEEEEKERKRRVAERRRQFEEQERQREISARMAKERSMREEAEKQRIFEEEMERLRLEALERQRLEDLERFRIEEEEKRRRMEHERMRQEEVERKRGEESRRRAEVERLKRIKAELQEKERIQRERAQQLREVLEIERQFKAKEKERKKKEELARDARKKQEEVWQTLEALEKVKKQKAPPQTQPQVQGEGKHFKPKLNKKVLGESKEKEIHKTEEELSREKDRKRKEEEFRKELALIKKQNSHLFDFLYVRSPNGKFCGRTLLKGDAKPRLIPRDPLYLTQPTRPSGKPEIVPTDPRKRNKKDENDNAITDQNIPPNTSQDRNTSNMNARANETKNSAVQLKVLSWPGIGANGDNRESWDKNGQKLEWKQRDQRICKEKLTRSPVQQLFKPGDRSKPCKQLSPYHAQENNVPQKCSKPLEGSRPSKKHVLTMVAPPPVTRVGEGDKTKECLREVRNPLQNFIVPKPSQGLQISLTDETRAAIDEVKKFQLLHQDKRF